MGNIIKYQNPSSPLINRVNKSKANFVQRLLDPNRKSIQNWVNPLSISTHKLGWATEDTKQGAFVYPEVQEIDGELADFTHPSHLRSEGINSAIERRDTVRMTPEQAKWFTENYKQYYPGFKDGGNIHIKPENKGKFTDYCGGKVTQECIQRGKHSSNPTTRKRATFAANARTWKHQEGGILNKLIDSATSMTNPLGHTLNTIHKIPFLQPYTKQVVNKINEHGEELVPKMWGFNDGRKARLKAAEMWQNGERFGKNYREHSDYIFNQEKEKYKENPKMISRSQRAAKIAVLGSLLGGYGELLSIPDQIYDWSASIDDPNIRNNAHTASNYLSELSRLTPTKYDDYIAPIGEAIGNIDDVLSGAGYDLFGLRKSKRQE